MILNDRVYQILKQLALIILPALASAYFALSSIWDLPKAEEIVGTVTVIDTLLGAILGLSTKAYNNSDAKYDGEFAIVPHEEGTALRLVGVKESSLENKDELTFKLTQS